MKLKALAGLVLALSIAGCATPQKPVQLTSRYNANEAQRLIQPGANIVSGSALIRQNGGGIVTCAGLSIMLIPHTEYAAERIRAIYGNTERGSNPIHRRLQFVPDDTRYLQLTRQAVCDAQGRFTFNDVADGRFYLISVINWQVGNAVQGGSLMQAVSVKGGESQEVVLSP